MNYEQYEIEGLIFEFRSTSADALNSTNTALGSVMMATQYDTLDPVFSNKMEMLNYEFSTSVKPSSSTMHMVECDPRQTPVNELYTLYNQTVAANADPRLYHLGRFCIATTGFQGTSVNIGELHVTYQVRLLKPKMFSNLGLDSSFFLANFQTTSGATLAYTNLQPFGSTAMLAAPLAATGSVIKAINSNMALTFTNTTITFPVCQTKKFWRAEFFWVGDGAAVVAVPPTNTVVSTNLTNLSSGVVPTSGDSCRTSSWVVGFSTNGGPVASVLAINNAGVLLPTFTAFQQLIVRIYQVTPESLAA